MKRAFMLAIFAILAVAGCQHDVILGQPPTDLAIYRPIDMTQSCGVNGCADLTEALHDLAGEHTADLAQ